jgi:hypothetical protein
LKYDLLASVTKLVGHSFLTGRRDWHGDEERKDIFFSGNSKRNQLSWLKNLHQPLDL